MTDKEVMELVKENLLLKFRNRMAYEYMENRMNLDDDVSNLKTILNCSTIDKPIIDVVNGRYINDDSMYV